MLYRLSTDELLERRILVARRRLLSATPEERHQKGQDYLDLIRQRSPVQVERMEKERGLV